MTSSGPPILFLLFLAIHGSLQKSTPASSSYRAAVIEYEPIIHANDSRKTLDENARRFVTLIEEASSKNMDIIVFPELGLTSLEFKNRSELINWASVVPNPSENNAPCKDSRIDVDPILRDISCAAEQNKIYVVINIVEKEDCSLSDAKECPTDDLFFYTTNVAFDRKGKIIARYRKRNEFNKFGSFDRPKSIEISTIETDFGVTFGNAMGSDILYEELALNLTKYVGVTDIVYPTVWHSVMPFMTAIQRQLDWALAKDVNFLAAGYYRFEQGYFGSGIYAGRHGSLKNTLPLSKNRTQMLALEVTKKPMRPVSADPMSEYGNNEEVKSTEDNKQSGSIVRNKLRRKRALSFPFLQYEKFDNFETRLVIPGDNDELTSVIQNLSHNKIDCEFKVNLTAQLPIPKPIYRFVAFDGVSTFDKDRIPGVKICALILCASESIDSCGQLRSAPAFFDSIEITARFENATRTLITPNTLDGDLLPVNIDKWNFRQLNDEGRATITLIARTDNLVTFGIWGRNFADSGASNFVSTIVSPMLINASLFLLLLQNSCLNFLYLQKSKTE